MQYYPSGLPWLEAYSPSEQPYKYNGKEFVEMHGLDEYDSKARWYYPAICRTTTVDPLADKYPHISPYVYCGNNPIKFVDPNGKDIWELNEQGSLVNKIADKTKDAIRMNGKQISFEHNSISNVTQDDYQTTFSFGNMNKIYVIHYKKSYVNNRIIPFCSQILTTVPLDNLYKI